MKANDQSPDLSEFERREMSGQKLRLDAILAAMDPEQRAKLDAALRLPERFSHYRVTQVLRAWGYGDLHEGSVRNWRARRLT